MNKEYTYLNNKVIISTDNGEQKIVDNCTNLDAILTQENVIETIENKIKELEEKMATCKEKRAKRFIPVHFLGAISAVILAPILFHLIWGENLFLDTINTRFGPMNPVLLDILVISVVVVPIISLFDVFDYFIYKNKLKEEQGMESELEYLRKQLITEQQKLTELKSKSQKIVEQQELKTIKVTERERLVNLKNYLELYYDLGYNSQKYLKYLENGNLETKLNQSYDAVGIDLAKDYLTEKSQTLSRRK